MNIFRGKIINRQSWYGVGLVAMLAAMIIPALAFADQVTQRSIALSSASASATNTSYDVKFSASATGAAGAFVIEFCGNSPVIGQTCDAPSGFNATTAASSTAGYTDVEGSTNKVIVTGAVTNSQAVNVVLTGITNPTNPGPFYARIVTYEDDTAAAAYPANISADAIDTGSVAMNITDTVGVSGAVLETMTFCVSGAVIDENCDTTGNPAPTLQLGETGGGTTALTPGVISSGSIYTQISTNAVGGAIVSLKSNAFGCGGLLRAGAAPGTCDIAPALDQGIAEGDSKFGVRTATATATTGVTGASGTLRPFENSVYNNSTYALNYAAGDESGVTSTYGDPFLDTDSAPVNNQNMQLTFGATINNNTPAGVYSTDLSLIATGKF